VTRSNTWFELQTHAAFSTSSALKKNLFRNQPGPKVHLGPGQCPAAASVPLSKRPRHPLSPSPPRRARPTVSRSPFRRRSRCPQLSKKTFFGINPDGRSTLGPGSAPALRASPSPNALASSLTAKEIVTRVGAGLPWLPRAVAIVFLGQNRGGDHRKTIATPRFICKSPRHARIRGARASHRSQVGYDAEHASP
jgi:hypothetical protein